MTEGLLSAYTAGVNFIHGKGTKPPMFRKLILAAAAVVAAFTIAACGDYSDGVRVGVIQKFSHKGIVFKTWEGTMLLGASTASAGSRTWNFTVEDAALAKKVKDLADKGAQVRVTYLQEYIGAFWRTGTGFFGPYFLVSAEATK